ncbi:UNVERIFIED_CONTAM: Dolichyl-diphosphooligosaccharide-protein glycosyltransferase subunit dad1 [Siphonaria sp. JEL0065]|nr:Dolichyl-diphosphooligosaccharide-protein glycosyltransferase subunit dad1 [Siphonaria sp. JEL0065]
MPHIQGANSSLRPRIVPSNYNPTFNKQERADFAHKLASLLKTSAKLRIALGQVAVAANEMHFGLKDLKRGRVWDGLKGAPDLTNDIELVAASYLQLAQTLNGMNAASVHTFDGPLSALAASYVGTFAVLEKGSAAQTAPFQKVEKKLVAQLKASQSPWSWKGSAADAERLLTEVAVAKSQRTAILAAHAVDVYTTDVATFQEVNSLARTHLFALKSALCSTLADNNRTVYSNNNNSSTSAHNTLSQATTLFNTPSNISPACHSPKSDSDASSSHPQLRLNADALASSLLDLDFSPRRWSPSPSEEGSDGLLTPMTLERDKRATVAPVLQPMHNQIDPFHQLQMRRQDQHVCRGNDSLSSNSDLPILITAPSTPPQSKTATENKELQHHIKTDSGCVLEDEIKVTDSVPNSLTSLPEAIATITTTTTTTTTRAMSTTFEQPAALTAPFHSRSSSTTQHRPSLKSALRSSSGSFLSGGGDTPAVSDSFQKQRSASVGGALFDLHKENTSMDSGNPNNNQTSTLNRRKMVHFTNPGRPMVEFWDCSDSKICTDSQSCASDSGTEEVVERDLNGGSAVIASTSVTGVTTDGTATTTTTTTTTGSKIKDVNVLRSLYPNMFVSEASNRISSKPVQHMQDVFFQENEQQKRVGPAVYFPPQADVESEVGSVVGGDASNSPIRMSYLNGKDLVFALYKYVARDAKEMSFEKGDVVEVHKRVGNWIYGIKIPDLRRESNASGFSTYQRKRESSVAGIRRGSSSTSSSSVSSVSTTSPAKEEFRSDYDQVHAVTANDPDVVPPNDIALLNLLDPSATGGHSRQLSSKRNIKLTAEELHEHSLQTKPSEDLFAYHSHVEKPKNRLEDDDLDWEDGIEKRVDLSIVEDEIVEEIEGEEKKEPSPDYENDTFEQMTGPVVVAEEHETEVDSEESLDVVEVVQEETNNLYGRLLHLLWNKKKEEMKPQVHDEIATELLKRLQKCEKNSLKSKVDRAALERKEALGNCIPPKMVNIVKFRNIMNGMSKLEELKPEAMALERERSQNLAVTSYVNQKLQLLRRREDELYVQEMEKTERGQMVMRSDHVAMIGEILKVNPRRRGSQEEVDKKAATAPAPKSKETQFALVARLYSTYLTTTPQLLRLIDAYLAAVMVSGIVQFVYVIAVGTFPYNSFLSGFIASVGAFVLAANLRMQLNPSNDFHSLSPEGAFAEFAFCSLVFYGFVVNFLG